MTFKLCTKCPETGLKSIEEFAFKNKKKGTHNAVCRACQARYANKHYKLNKSKYLKNAKMRHKSHREFLHKKLGEYYSCHPCVDCNESDIVVLQPDHVRGKKSANISMFIRNFANWLTIKAELEKCEIRCANCHTKRTARQFKWWRTK